MVALASITGAFAGLLAGGLLAAAVFMAHGPCIIPIEAELDLLFGPLFGLWYGPVAFDWFSRWNGGRPIFAPDPTWHVLIDTLFGGWVGYHFGSGIVAASTSLSNGLAPLVVALGAVTLGGIFFLSSHRWSRGKLAR